MEAECPSKIINKWYERVEGEKKKNKESKEERRIKKEWKKIKEMRMIKEKKTEEE